MTNTISAEPTTDHLNHLCGEYDRQNNAKIATMIPKNRLNQICGAVSRDIAPMIGGASGAESGKPIADPQFLAERFQSKIPNNDQSAADMKNGFGFGKNDLNIGLVFLSLALDSG